MLRSAKCDPRRVRHGRRLSCGGCARSCGWRFLMCVRRVSRVCRARTPVASVSTITALAHMLTVIDCGGHGSSLFIALSLVNALSLFTDFGSFSTAVILLVRLALRVTYEILAIESSPCVDDAGEGAQLMCRPESSSTALLLQQHSIEAAYACQQRDKSWVLPERVHARIHPQPQDAW